MPRSTSVDNDHRDSLRRARFDAQKVIWRETRIKRVAMCGRSVSDLEAGVTVRVTDGGRAGFSGLQTCGSVWACPVCSEKINAKRQQEIAAGLNYWLEQGHAVVFVTFTMQHNKGHRLAELLDAMAPAWNRTTSGAGRAWNGGKNEPGDKSRFGIRGVLRLSETKHGANGWHPHVHALMFLDKDLTDHQLEDLRGRLFGRWESALADHNLKTLARSRRDGKHVGVDIRRVRDAEYLADYFAKNGYRPRGTTAASGAAYEVTGSHSKRRGADGSRTPFQILGDLVNGSTGEVPDGWTPESFDRDLRLWHEWEKASKGRRQLTWSRGLRKLLHLDQLEQTDEEVVEAADLEGDAVITIPTVQWKEHRWFERRAELLEAAEAGTLARLFAGGSGGVAGRLRRIRVHE